MRDSHFISKDTQWKSDILAQFISTNIVNSILKIFIPSNMSLEKIFWSLSSDGSIRLNLELFTSRVLV